MFDWERRFFFIEVIVLELYIEKDNLTIFVCQKTGMFFSSFFEVSIFCVWRSDRVLKRMFVLFENYATFEINEKFSTNV